MSSTDPSTINRKFIIEISPQVLGVELENPAPVPTPTPTVTPTPLPSSLFYHDLSEGHIVLNQFVADPPTGFDAGRVDFFAIPSEGSLDGLGMEINLSPGQGIFAVSQQPIDTREMVKITGRLQAINSEPAVALVALNYPIDGQFAYINLSDAALPVNRYRDVELYYQPPSGQLLVGLQAVNPSDARTSTKVYVDRFVVNRSNYQVGSPIVLQVDGSFDSSISGLIANINGDSGDVTPFFQTLNDVAIHLSVGTNDDAANIGTTATGITHTMYPFNMLSGVTVQRETAAGGGMFAMVVTNGFQNMGVFRLVDQLPSAAEAAPELVIVGGRFDADNPAIPITAVVQNGGAGAESSMIVDDLALTRE